MTMCAVCSALLSLRGQDTHLLDWVIKLQEQGRATPRRACMKKTGLSRDAPRSSPQGSEGHSECVSHHSPSLSHRDMRASDGQEDWPQTRALRGNNTRTAILSVHPQTHSPKTHIDASSHLTHSRTRAQGHAQTHSQRYAHKITRAQRTHAHMKTTTERRHTHRPPQTWQRDRLNRLSRDKMIKASSDKKRIKRSRSKTGVEIAHSSLAHTQSADARCAPATIQSYYKV